MKEKWEKLLRHDDYDLSIDGMRIRVNDGVFTPDPEYTYSSSMLLKNLPDVRGKSVLDIGSGTGVVALKCALNGAEHVVATDVSRMSLKNIEVNAVRLGVIGKIEIRESNLFSAVPERFDYVFANLPILDETWSLSEGMAQHIIDLFLQEVDEHLNPEGNAFLAWASFGDIGLVKKCLSVFKKNFNETHEERLGYTWYLFTISKNS